MHSPHDTIHIAILAARYDMYYDTLFRLEIISNCMRIILWSSTMVFTILQSLFEMVHSHKFNIFGKSFIMWKVYSINFSSVNRSKYEHPSSSTKLSYLDIQCSKIVSVQNNVPFIQWRLIDFTENCYCKMAWNTENSMKGYLTTFSWVFWELLL